MNIGPILPNRPSKSGTQLCFPVSCYYPSQNTEYNKCLLIDLIIKAKSLLVFKADILQLIERYFHFN
jgi:hypothetical protein